MLFNGYSASPFVFSQTTGGNSGSMWNNPGPSVGRHFATLRRSNHAGRTGRGCECTIRICLHGGYVLHSTAPLRYLDRICIDRLDIALDCMLSSNEYMLNVLQKSVPVRRNLLLGNVTPRVAEPLAAFSASKCVNAHLRIRLLS